MSGGNYIVSKHFKTLSIAIVVFLWLTLGCFAAGLTGNIWVVMETITTTNQTAQLTIGKQRIRTTLRTPIDITI